MDNLEQDTKHLIDGLEPLHKDLINFTKELTTFARQAGDELSKEVDYIRRKIEELEKKLEEQPLEYKKHSPTTRSDPSDWFSLFTTASGILASSSTIATLATMMSPKVVKGSVVVAAGSARAVSTLTDAALAAVITLIWITTSQILWTLSTSCPLIQDITLCPEEAMSTPELPFSLQLLVVNFGYISYDDTQLCFEIISVGRFPKLKVLHLSEIYHTPYTPPAIITKSATIPQLREYLLETWSKFHSRDTTAHDKAAMVYGFLARHIQLQSFSVYASPREFWVPLFLERDHCSNLRVLCVGNVQVTDTVSPSLAGELQKLPGCVSVSFIFST
ncbi:hypothetical protein M422DRAFT_256357 [Sphaerobolus stellatus SS14]|uniref:Uncharacterized protein n=1 Tax=Sphaerobolus stellatus (strain SS14) TaxID=990650 RepID=A0A0C9VRP6_SPHS4|nr:hypothetical protein M422DRAFT_256357 [Sphaerobolus stellatus SS14]